MASLGIRETPDGCVPFCEACRYVGVPRPHSRAVAALKQHKSGAAHRWAVRIGTLTREARRAPRQRAA
jgi:hypothetical protein